MNITRNGAAESFTVNDSQRGALSLGLSAYDGQIGMGSITIPGNIPTFGAGAWYTGDRISVYEDGSLIYTGFVMDRSRHRGVEPADVETTFQLMDLNRQLIGRKVVDWDRPAEPAENRLAEFIDRYLSDLTLDLTWVDSDTTEMPPKVYTGDGIMDLLSDLILYTGKTLFLAPKTDTEFELHWHDLNSGVTAGLGASDNPLNPLALFTSAVVIFGGDPVTFDTDTVVFGTSASTIVVPLREPEVSYSASDVKAEFDVRNGVGLTGRINPASVAAYGQGGLKFEAVLDYSGVNDETLYLIGTNLLYTAANPKPTYTCTLGPLSGAQVAAIPPGAMFIVESTVMDLSGGGITRITNIDLTLTRDDAGNAMPGRWDAALELSYPRRLPAAIVGYGAQGGDSGRLSRPKTWVETVVTVDDPDVPVGGTTTATAQLVDEDGVAVPVPDVVLNWDVLQFSDEAETVPTSDWSTAAATSLTDISGQATMVLSHDADTGTVKWRARAEP